MVQTSDIRESIKTCHRKSASNDNAQQKETARDYAEKRKQDPLRMQKKGVRQGLCFNSAHGCPITQLVPQAWLPQAKSQKHGCPTSQLVPQPGVCSTTGHYQMLKHFHMGEDEHCLTREEGRLRTTWQEEGNAGLVVEKERANEEKTLHVETIEKQGIWWWTALSSSQETTCLWKTLLQSFLVEVRQVLRRYRLTVEQGGNQAWLGHACSVRSGGGGWWNSCGIITS